MPELLFDPHAYQWHDRADDHVELPVTATYKITLARQVRVGVHLVEHRYTVYSPNPWPRIPGVKIIHIHNITDRNHTS